MNARRTSSPAPSVLDVRRRRLGAAPAIACVALLAACGSGSSATHAAAGKTPAGHPVVTGSYPVYQLPPGHVTLAYARTPGGPVAITLHRIRYFGHVSLCVSLSDAQGATSQSCADYPIGPRSNQHIGDSPVWWAANDIQLCSTPRFQVVAGVLLRRGLTAWLRTPSGNSLMPHAAIPRPFDVAGGLVYATLTGDRDRVVLRRPAGPVVYSAPVEPLTALPPIGCGGGVSSAGGSTTAASSATFALVPAGEHVVP